MWFFALIGIIRILDLPAYGGRILFALSPIWECPGEAVYCNFSAIGNIWRWFFSHLISNDIWGIPLTLSVLLHFCAHKSHGLNLGYRQLLQELYYGQRGILNDNVYFPIERGVRQGDVFFSKRPHTDTQKLTDHRQGSKRDDKSETEPRYVHRHEGEQIMLKGYLKYRR